jgi:hypothetical protein
MEGLVEALDPPMQERLCEFYGSVPLGSCLSCLTTAESFGASSLS